MISNIQIYLSLIQAVFVFAMLIAELLHNTALGERFGWIQLVIALIKLEIYRETCAIEKEVSRTTYKPDTTREDVG